MIKYEPAKTPGFKLPGKELGKVFSFPGGGESPPVKMTVCCIHKDGLMLKGTSGDLHAIEYGNISWMETVQADEVWPDDEWEDE